MNKASETLQWVRTACIAGACAGGVGLVAVALLLWGTYAQNGAAGRPLVSLLIGSGLALFGGGVYLWRRGRRIRSRPSLPAEDASRFPLAAVDASLPPPADADDEPAMVASEGGDRSEAGAAAQEAGEQEAGERKEAPRRASPPRVQTLSVTYTLSNGQRIQTTGQLFCGSRPFSLADLRAHGRTPGKAQPHSVMISRSLVRALRRPAHDSAPKSPRPPDTPT
ncbi:MAG TPA: DUF202 domain-containing protein [Limnochordia bacterium]